MRFAYFCTEVDDRLQHLIFSAQKTHVIVVRNVGKDVNNSLVHTGLETKILEHSPSGQVTFKLHSPRSVFTRPVSIKKKEKKLAPPSSPPMNNKIYTYNFNF